MSSTALKNIFLGKYEKLKEKYKAKKQKLRELENIEEERNNEVELEEGSGCFVDKVKLENIIILSKTSTIMARSLFKQCFGKEVIATHSLHGKGKMQLPEIDGKKRNSIYGEKCFIINNNY